MKKTIFIAIVFLFGCASGKPLMENKAQIAENMNMKLADKLNGIEQNFNGKLAGVEKAVVDFTAKADAQLSAVAGVNNKISKSVSELRIGNIGGSFNDTGLLKTYIKYLSYAVCGLILSNFLLGLLMIIGLIVVIVYLLKSDRINDAAERRKKEIV